METLNNAARAAGFAMAASEDPYEDTANAEVQAEATSWRPAEPVMLKPAVLERGPRTGDWFRSMFSLFGRRAPASPI